MSFPRTFRVSDSGGLLTMSCTLTAEPMWKQASTSCISRLTVSVSRIEPSTSST